MKYVQVLLGLDRHRQYMWVLERYAHKGRLIQLDEKNWNWRRELWEVLEVYYQRARLLAWRSAYYVGR